MHVLLVCAARGVPLYGPSGASAHLRGVAGALLRRGHRLTVLVATLGDPSGHPTLAAPVRSLPERSWPRRRRARERAEEEHAAALMALAPDDVDLVWHRHALHDGAIRRWCEARGVPRWLEVNAPLALERALLDPLAMPRRARREEHRSLVRADRVLVVSRWLQTWARALGARDVQWLPNGSALGTGRRERTRRRLDLHGPVLGFIGSGRPWHRVDRLPALLDALPEATGLLVGDGPVRPTHPRLRQLPFAADPADVVATMDVGLVLGGLPWVCPMKVFDYCSQGVPVVAVPVGDTPHLPGLVEHVLPWGSGWPKATRRALAAPRTVVHRGWDDVVAEAFGVSGG